MTMRTMERAVALVVVALIFGACGGGEPAADLEAARADAREALDAVGELTTRLDALEDELADSSGSVERVRAELDDAVASLKESLKAAKAKTAGASSEAADALAQAQAAAAEVAALARRLAVLEDRYDYHLKRYHGGG